MRLLYPLRILLHAHPSSHTISTAVTPPLRVSDIVVACLFLLVQDGWGRTLHSETELNMSTKHAFRAFKWVSANRNLGPSSKRECGSNADSPSSLIYTTSSQVYFEPQPQPPSRLTDHIIIRSYRNGVFCTLRKISLHLRFTSLHSSNGYQRRGSRFSILRRGEASFAWKHTTSVSS